MLTSPVSCDDWDENGQEFTCQNWIKLIGLRCVVMTVSCRICRGHIIIYIYLCLKYRNDQIKYSHFYAFTMNRYVSTQIIIPPLQCMYVCVVTSLLLIEYPHQKPISQSRKHVPQNTGGSTPIKIFWPINVPTKRYFLPKNVQPKKEVSVISTKKMYVPYYLINNASRASQTIQVILQMKCELRWHWKRCPRIHTVLILIMARALIKEIVNPNIWREKVP